MLAVAKAERFINFMLWPLQEMLRASGIERLSPATVQTVKLINWAKQRSCALRHVQKQESSSRYELLKLTVCWVVEASRHGTSRVPRACAVEHLRPRHGTAPPPAPLHRVAAIAFTSWLSPQ
ncbi:unnamed protein product [Spodoptera exigua]|nr:unnamed protein product [Spodoptera exigua]